MRRIDRPALLTRKQTAKKIGVQPRTLSKPKWLKDGPPFVRLSGNRVGYPPDELDAWIDARPRGGAGSDVAEKAA